MNRRISTLTLTLISLLATSCGESGALGAPRQKDPAGADRGYTVPDSDGDSPFPPDDSIEDWCALFEDQGQPARFTEDELISPCGRRNPLAVDSSLRDTMAELGVGFTLEYPVDVTGFLVPYRPLRTVLEGETDNSLRKLMAEAAPLVTGIESIEDLYDDMGLVRGVDGEHWGVTIMDTPDGEGLTFSCAACHAGRLFGTPVLGLHNRIGRANRMFVTTKPMVELASPTLFQIATGATPGEMAMWERTRTNMQFIRSVEPRALGLDTALAHTILSLSLREADPWATRTDESAASPRYNALEVEPCDVKPATWWLTKYKNKYFSDGSLVSGNPALASVLINEYGRGSDLHEVDEWIDNEWSQIENLTAALFTIEPPSYFDYFPVESFDLDGAKRGQELFAQHCSRCHGEYIKGWDRADLSTSSRRERLATVEVHYFENTPVMDVGTDTKRAESIAYLQELNQLAIAEKHNIVLQTQTGYVPPPLVGIWARWPYFHNMAAPTLCDVLTRAEERPDSYMIGEVIDRDRDFDRSCNGYPRTTPEHFVEQFDSSISGLSNSGHDEGIFLRDGQELLTPEQKTDIITFLKTL